MRTPSRCGSLKHSRESLPEEIVPPCLDLELLASTTRAYISAV